MRRRRLARKGMPVARKIVLAVLVLVFVGGIVVFSLPANYLPERVRPNPVIRGEFSGKPPGGEPVEIAVPDSKPGMVRVSLMIKRVAGICRVSNRNPQGDILWAFTMRAGKWTGRLPAGHTLIIEASESGGGYRFESGSQWSLFSSKMRLVAIACCIGGLAGLWVKRSRGAGNLVRRLGPRRIYFAGAVVMVSGLVLYSTIHEFGHYIVGTMLGAEVSEVAWTVLSGVEPHVSFSSMPEEAGPWMSAAGPILPTLVAVVLISIWLVFAKRMSWYLGVCLLAPSMVFLFAGLGCVFELFDSGVHMNRLSAHLGLQGVTRVIFELLPLLVSLLMFAMVARRIRAMTKSLSSPPKR